MADKFVHISNDDTQSYRFCRLHLVVKTLDIQLNEPTNQIQYKSQNLGCQRIRKRYHKTLGTSVINCQFPPTYLVLRNI